MTKITSAAGRAFIQKWEGCRLDAYKAEPPAAPHFEL